MDKDTKKMLYLSMMKKWILFTLALLVGCGLFAQNTVEDDPDLKYAADMLKKGTPAPDFTLSDINGKPVSIKDFLGKKVVLVFWASWCPDCRAEVPELKAMHAAADPEKVAFVSVSFDRTEEAWRNYVQENELPGVQLFDASGKKDSAVGDAYHIKWIPALYLIDEKGQIQLATVVAAKVAAALKGK